VNPGFPFIPQKVTRYGFGLLLEHGIIDREAEALVQDLDSEQFGRGGGAILVGAGAGDVKGRHLIGVPGVGDFLEALTTR
jgi:hypothetical protein